MFKNTTDIVLTLLLLGSLVVVVGLLWDGLTGSQSRSIVNPEPIEIEIEFTWGPARPYASRWEEGILSVESPELLEATQCQKK